MFFDTENNTRVAQFGTGDIWIAAGFIKDGENIVGTLSLGEGDKGEIGRTVPEWDSCTLDEDFTHIPVRLVFTDIRSLDMLLEELGNARKYMTRETAIPDCSGYERLSEPPTTDDEIP